MKHPKYEEKFWKKKTKMTPSHSLGLDTIRILPYDRGRRHAHFVALDQASGSDHDVHVLAERRHPGGRYTYCVIISGYLLNIS